MTLAASRLSLRPQDQTVIRAILSAKIPDREVLAFGSRARGRAKPFSDLDLAILGQDALPLPQLAELREAFEDSDLPFRVDLVDWNTIEDAFRAIIRREAVLIQSVR
ncbi:nucleotidyltransferase family protein [uncultured Alsobacter sp.]|uniref:nucleotidyltransferase family protein n=1 Tax=uncultured Alsobacter sp. TaxID=1748258 RepID=UPI0025D4C7D2|nr:nucleotidyltransferase domain-containing protein [uncultured Alsobacter sp.]